MSYANVYYDPAKFALHILGIADNSAPYEFDMFIVWTDQQGRYLWASDAGCSCPTPFEGFDLSNLPVGSAADALNDLRVWGRDEYEGHGRQRASEALAFLLERAS